MTLLPPTTFLSVDRENFTLTRYTRRAIAGKWRRAGIFSCTIGSVGHETPRGLFEVTNKTRTPDWRKPNSEWVPEDERGKLVPFMCQLCDGDGLVHVPGDDETVTRNCGLCGGTGKNPENPFSSGFISLWDGVGIHDTKFDPLVGTASSHGCIRLRTEDFLRLYDKVPVGTPVFII